MSEDPFASIKAQLDNQAKWWLSERERFYHNQAILKSALQEIVAIKPDGNGNGLKLAINIASKVINDFENEI